MNNRIFSRPSATLAKLAAAPLVLLSLAISPVYGQAASPLEFRSAFEGYKPYTDEKTIDWKRANDNVGKIGGWREYAREASQPDNAAGPAVIPATSDPKNNPKADPTAGSAKP